MFLLVIFGLGMFGLGCFMVGKPLLFSRGIVRFCEKKWFHSFEIISRAIFGVVFLMFSAKTSYPAVVTVLGVVLCFASIFLIIIGPARHKQFALLTSRIGKNFRYLGFVAVVFGAVLVYVGLVRNA